MSKRGLGKGLAALLPSNTSKVQVFGEPMKISVAGIVPNKFQPRVHFDLDSLQELARSITEHGIIQPLVVRKAGDKYELIAGERRLKAAKIAGFTEVPVIVLDLNDQQVTEVSLIENVQRQDLNPMEEAHCYYRLVNEFGLTQEELSGRVGKSRSFIANMVRLVNLPGEIQQLVKDNILSAGHARCLLAIDRPERQLALALQIAHKHLSVRQTEQLVKNMLEETKNVILDKSPASEQGNKLGKRAKSPLLLEVEEQFRQTLGTKVIINQHDGQKGKIEIEYYSDDDLNRIIDLITGKQDL